MMEEEDKKYEVFPFNFFLKHIYDQYITIEIQKYAGVIMHDGFKKKIIKSYLYLERMKIKVEI